MVVGKGRLGMILSANLLIRSLAWTDVVPKQIITDEVRTSLVVPMYQNLLREAHELYLLSC